MTSVEDTQSDPTKPAPKEEEWQAAEKVLTSLQLARKNYSLYPENHVNCGRALEQFWLQLDKYLRAHGNLRFDLAKDKLLFQGEVILSEPPEEGTLPFTLFRDGIQWLELQQGIDSDEVEQFLRLLNRYRILTDEPEGDLVTALWEAKFPHIQYYVAEMFWGAEPEFDLSSSHAGQEDAEVLEEEEKDSKSECFPPIEPAALKITPEEEAELREMVRLEEKRDPVYEYLDILLDSLLELREKENFVPVLESLEDVFHDSLARKNFETALKILKSLHYVRKTLRRPGRAPRGEVQGRGPDRPPGAGGGRSEVPEGGQGRAVLPAGSRAPLRHPWRRRRQGPGDAGRARLRLPGTAGLPPCGLPDRQAGGIVLRM